VNGRSHYDVLGVVPEAPPEAIRESYRRLAREFHPDRTVGSAAGADRMPQINEAYRVLSDPGRRAVYDAERRGTPQPARSATTTTTDSPAYQFQYPDGPARVPWRGLLVASLIAIIAIVGLAQFSNPSGPGAPDGILRNGDCVEILDNNDAKEIACTGSGDLVVRQFITPDAVCGNGYARHRDRQGMGFACVEQQPVTPPTL